MHNYSPQNFALILIKTNSARRFTLIKILLQIIYYIINTVDSVFQVDDNNASFSMNNYNLQTLKV